MYFIEQKLEQRIDALKNYIYRDKLEASCMETIPDTSGVPAPGLPGSYEGWERTDPGTEWTGRDKYLWLHTTLRIPADWSAKKIFGIFDFGSTGGGNNSGFEALLYLDGKPYHGVDGNHREILLPDDSAGKEIDLLFRLWSGLEGHGHRPLREQKMRLPYAAWQDEETKDLYYNGRAVLETIHVLDENDPVRYELRNLLNHCYLLIDWTYPGEEEFYQSVKEADAALKEALAGMEKKNGVTVYGIGHTHIDVAWLWRLRHTREKAARSFSTVLRLMEEYPEYVFLQTQPQLYEYVKKDFPDIYEKIRERVKEGRWEIDGAMWLEADCNLISGESFVRQILLGKKFVREEFGKEMEYLWLPDVFGYSAAMPQILARSGIKTFMTTKISWNQYNRMPYDTFWWQGIDGSRILTHFITAPDADADLGPWFYTYSGQMKPYVMKGIWDNYKQKDLNQDLLIAFGYGDGGGGPNREMLEMRRAMDQVPGLPTVKIESAGEYFRKLQQTLCEAENPVPEWRGELYLELCRGTYTSQAWNKKMNRRMEFFYRETEWIMALNWLNGADTRQDQENLNEGFKILLRNQFHDIIPGSSIHEVYEDSRIEYAEAQSLAAKIRHKYLADILEASENTYTVINNAGFARGGLVLVPEERPGSFYDKNGSKIESQDTDGGKLVSISGISPMGFYELYFRKEEAGEEPSPFEVFEGGIETPFYRIRLNENGQLTEIYDKENCRKVLKEGERGNVFQIFEDEPLNFDAWNIDLFYQEKYHEVSELVTREVTELGNLRAVIHMEWVWKKSRILQNMILYAHKRRIDFETTVDFHGHHQLLKTAFPVNVFSDYATYDIQYGNIRRNTCWNTSWDMAKFEVCAHRFADLSEYGYGVSLMNDSKYGYDIKDHTMRLSLIKTATDPDPEQDQGLHTFTYSLLPHRGSFVEGNTVEEAFDLNQPLTLETGCLQNGNASPSISLNGTRADLDAVKVSEDGSSLVIRFHEYAGGRGRVTLGTSFACGSWCESDLMENPVEDWKETQPVEVELAPYEIKTLLIRKQER